MSKVAFQGVTKRFDDDTIALRKFDLYIEDGEFVVLVGPSGCGKSTALRLLAGLEPVSEGRILIDEKVVNTVSPQQRNIAMVFQNYALYPHMSVRRNLEFPLRMSHTPRRIMAKKVEHIARILDLSDLLERKPKQLSGGQRQRVAMGRALVRDPSVFLLDEPLSNLDAKLRAQIRADIAKIQNTLNKTTLYVTHDQVEAMTLGDRVAVMNAGQIQQIDTPAALYERPKNIFVAKFLGSPGMNIVLSTLIVDGANKLAVRLGNQSITLSQDRQQANPAITKFIGQPILVGIRPEAISATQVMNSVGLKLNILSVEFLGHESLVYFHCPDAGGSEPGDVVIARIVGKVQSPIHKNAEFFIDPDAIYLFNQEGLIIDGP